MGKFTEVLNEVYNNKVYQFQIGVAGELAEDFVDHLETCLKKFDIVEMSAGKKTPIQERPLDFPQLQNMEVTYYEVTLNYPTTPQMLEDYVEKCCPCEPSHVIVRNMNDDRADDNYAKQPSEPYESKLETEEMEQADPDAQDKVAGNRVMDLLKELETARKERNIDPQEGAPKGESKDIDTSENTKAVIGG